MSLVGIYSDTHVSLNSSILTGNEGSRYSKRLDRIVDSSEWMYSTFKEYGVDMVINGGDLTDSDILLPEENSALAEIYRLKSSILPDVVENVLLGNHELRSKNHKFHSIAVIDNYDNVNVIDTPTKIGNISFLPYTSDYSNYGIIQELKNDILISHADYLGLSYNNSVVINHGFDPNYCLENFKIIFNGHLHTARDYHDNRLLNIGSSVGSGFSDSYSSYNPGIIILDTDTLQFKRIENPESPLFISIKASTISELIKAVSNLTKSRYYCLKIEVPYEIRDDARKYLETTEFEFTLLASRVKGIITQSSIVASKEELQSIMSNNSPTEALIKFVDLQDNLPADKSEVMSFIDSYLCKEGDE